MTIPVQNYGSTVMAILTYRAYWPNTGSVLYGFVYTAIRNIHITIQGGLNSGNVHKNIAHSFLSFTDKSCVIRNRVISFSFSPRVKKPGTVPRDEILILQRRKKGNAAITINKNKTKSIECLTCFSEYQLSNSRHFPQRANLVIVYKFAMFPQTLFVT